MIIYYRDGCGLALKQYELTCSDLVTGKDQPIPVAWFLFFYLHKIFRVADTDPYPDPDWIRIQSDHWIRIRIQEGKNEPQK